MSVERGALHVVTAPSGVGKSTIIQRVLASLPGIEFSVSCTTRPRRPSETDGVDYRFLDEREFRRLIDDGAFLEWAEVHGNLYGTERRAVDSRLASGVDVMLDIDVDGADQLRAAGADARFIFIMPPDFGTLKNRLENRRTETAASLARRIANATGEIRAWERFDHVVVNDDLERAVEEVAAIVRGARTTRARRAARARAIVATFPEPGQHGAGR